MKAEGGVVIEKVSRDLICVHWTPIVGKLIRSLYGIDPKFKAVKDWINPKHWELPTNACSCSMASLARDHGNLYIHQIKALLTCDAFGAYAIPKSTFLEDLTDKYV